jgi:stress-induced morphogen
MAKEKIQAALQPSSLSVTSTHDDPNGSHISISIVSSAFEGVSRVKRQARLSSFSTMLNFLLTSDELTVATNSN